jgi:hypothetical protein
MIDHSKLSGPRLALIVWWALAASLMPQAAAPAIASTALKVEASDGLPGFHRNDLPSYLAAHMAEVGLADWRFEPTADDSSAPNRVEWSFRLNPYAGGEVRSFVRSAIRERSFGVHRPITIEARLYLNGEYQTLVEKQAIIQGGAGDPDLAAAVASVTQDLLGPLGAYRAVDTGQPRAYRP